MIARLSYSAVRNYGDVSLRRVRPLTPFPSPLEGEGQGVRGNSRAASPKERTLRNAIDDKGRRLRHSLSRPVYRSLAGAVGHHKNVVGEQFLVGLAPLKNLLQVQGNLLGAVRGVGILAHNHRFLRRRR